MPAETCTHSLAYVVEQTGVPSEDWLRRKLNAGEIPGRRAGRIWRMTDSDIAALVDYLARPARASGTGIRSIAETPAASASGLTPRAKRNLHRRQPA
ncbi:hypothetical protein [Nocardia sp. NPDC004260]